jgi:hypothetical protein
MAKSSEVLKMLCPGVEWYLIGDKFEDIDWMGQTPPITKKQYQDGFAAFDAWKDQEELAKASAKNALLDRLGITADEAAILLG